MAQKNELIEQMLEHLVNDDQTKAEELFHEYVVAKSREIYEGLIESEMPKDEEEDEDKEDDDERKDEGFDDEVAVEAPEMDDETDDLEMELDAEMDDEDDDMEEKSEEELFQDLDAIVDELQAKFDELKGDDMDDMGGDEEMKDEFELETVREYVEKVPGGHGAEKKGAAEQSDKSSSGLKFGKNDMGGTSANILGGKNGSDAGVQGMTGDLKGNGLLKGKPQLQDGGNVNTPGAKNGNAFSKKEPGHGAEKKGQAEGSTDGQSLFRGRR